ncbi:MAG TPA: hypothetical protein VGM56_11580 [Byssovorax sp.]|jgi:hypothetical protein
MSLSLPALAQNNANCPPGSWFCADADPPAAQPAPPAAPQNTTRAPRHAPAAESEDADDDAPPAAQQQTRRGPPGEYGRPPVVVYDGPPPPARVVIVAPGYRPFRPPPPAMRPRWVSEWGVNLHIEGMAFGRSAAEAAGMGGVGAALRFRPVPHFALEAGVDFIAGNDFNGFQRTETPFTLNGILFVNPRSRAQLYLMGGMLVSHADVQSDQASPLLQRQGNGWGAEYTYFGGQAGGGIEFRVSRRVALDLDVLGFLRKRTDDGKTPEFVDVAHNRATNTSDGAIIRGGLVLYF